MPEASKQDLTLIMGDAYSRVFALFSDARVKQWRGEWHEYFMYEPGEAVELEPGEAFVALLKSMVAKPGAEGSEEFWSPLTPKDLTDYEVTLVCGTLFTLTEGHGLTVTPKLGKIEVEVEPAQIAAAPTSERYYVQIVNGEGKPSTPVSGTMIFKQP
ncbi:MAG TPA: hypothetical protein VK756_07755 [Solirubrobacteraceae bacterium]|jgi:hypothetical protein|nr:hypothetical protein [Solirubrobacteraceae bacterium]